jgi:hypothetical protein
MERFHDFAEVEQKILADIRRCLESVRHICQRDVTSARDGVNVLSKLRQVAYENRALFFLLFPLNYLVIITKWLAVV